MNVSTSQTCPFLVPAARLPSLIAGESHWAADRRRPATFDKPLSPAVHAFSERGRHISEVLIFLILVSLTGVVLVCTHISMSDRGSPGCRFTFHRLLIGGAGTPESNHCFSSAGMGGALSPALTPQTSTLFGSRVCVRLALHPHLILLLAGFVVNYNLSSKISSAELWDHILKLETANTLSLNVGTGEKPGKSLLAPSSSPPVLWCPSTVPCFKNFCR